MSECLLAQYSDFNLMEEEILRGQYNNFLCFANIKPGSEWFLMISQTVWFQLFLRKAVAFKGAAHLASDLVVKH